MNDEQLKRLHFIMLEEIKALHYICEKNNIRYVANGGTCLGAIREKGFIPWDDDVDIMMIREDYIKFGKVVNEELEKYDKSQYKFYMTEHDGVRGYRIATDIDDELLGKQTVEIDVLVYDRLPKSKILGKIMRYRLLSYRAMIKRPRGKVSLLKTIYVKIMEFIGSIKTFKGVQKSHNKVATRYNNSKKASNFYLSTGDSYYIVTHNSYPVEWFTERILVPFENIMIYVPKMFDTYLTYEYGNYMERPPLEEQKPSHDKF